MLLVTHAQRDLNSSFFRCQCSTMDVAHKFPIMCFAFFAGLDVNTRPNL